MNVFGPQIRRGTQTELFCPICPFFFLLHRKFHESRRKYILCHTQFLFQIFFFSVTYLRVCARVDFLSLFYDFRSTRIEAHILIELRIIKCCE